MKVIAIPTNNGYIEDHFGQCRYYTVVKTDEKNKVTSKEVFPTPSGCGCKSNLAEILREKGVNMMIAGNMGQGARNILTSAGITVMCGFSGSVENALKMYLEDGFEGDDTVCHHHHHHDHHDHGQGHGHGHGCDH